MAEDNNDSFLGNIANSFSETGKSITRDLPFFAEQTIKDPNATPDQQMAAMQELEQQEQAQQQQALVDAETQFQKFQTDMQRSEAFNAKAAKYGIKPVATPTPEEYGLSSTDVARLTAPNIRPQVEQAVQQAEKDEYAQSLENLQKESMKLQDQQLAMAQGQAASMAKQQAELQRRYDDINKELDSEQLKLSEIDANRFWSDKSTGTKILGSIAIALGEVGRSLTRSEQNNALNIINNAIDKDIAEQRLNNENKLKLKENGLERARLELTKFAQLADSEGKRQAILSTANQLKQQAVQLRMQQVQTLMLNRAARGPGIPPAVAEYAIPADDPRRDLMVPLPNGNIAIASSQAAQKQLVTKLNETQPAVEFLKDFENLAQNSSRMSIEDRALLSSKLSQAAGKLRLAILGPGVMTPEEFDRLVGSLGNPNSMVFKDIELKKLRNTTQSLQKDINTYYKNAGINVPVSKREQAIEASMKKGNSRQAAEAAADKLGIRD